MGIDVGICFHRTEPPATGHLDKVVITLTGARLPPTETDIEFID